MCAASLGLAHAHEEGAGLAHQQEKRPQAGRAGLQADFAQVSSSPLFFYLFVFKPFKEIENSKSNKIKSHHSTH
jgi:hypothetical protein